MYMPNVVLQFIYFLKKIVRRNIITQSIQSHIFKIDVVKEIGNTENSRIIFVVCFCYILLLFSKPGHILLLPSIFYVFSI